MSRHLIHALCGVALVAVVAQARAAVVTGHLLSGEAPVADAEVVLTAASGDVLRAKSDRSGAFAFPGVAAGLYTLTVLKNGYAAATRPGVRITAADEQKIGTLDMTRLAAVEFFVSPPVDPAGHAWQLSIDRTLPESTFLDTIRKGSADPTGYWTPDALEPGGYTLSVRTASGAEVERKRIEIAEDDVVAITVAHIPIRGKLTSGGEPLAAEIGLVAEDGSRMEARSDAGGAFTGVVAREGSYRARIRFDGGAERHMDEVDIRRNAVTGLADVNIELPAGALRGRVIDAQKRPTRGTIMIFDNMKLVANAQTAEDGTFKIIALEPGTRQVRAITAGGSSALTHVDIEEDEPTSMTLTIDPSLRIIGELVDSAGLPVPGASIHYNSATSGPGMAQSGLAGDFAITIPPGAPTLYLAIAVLGLPRRIVTVPLAAIDAAQPLRIVIGPAAGRMRMSFKKIPPVPWVSRDGTVFFSLYSLLAPHPGRPPHEWFDGAMQLDVEPGVYVVCPAPRPSTGCSRVNVASGTTSHIDLTSFFLAGGAP